MRGVKEVIRILEIAERQGAETDVPEGSRYIQISETLVDIMVEMLIEDEQEFKTKTAEENSSRD